LDESGALLWQARHRVYGVVARGKLCVLIFFLRILQESMAVPAAAAELVGLMDFRAFHVSFVITFSVLKY
jgi:hypothetical protein